MKCHDYKCKPGWDYLTTPNFSKESVSGFPPCWSDGYTLIWVSCTVLTSVYMIFAPCFQMPAVSHSTGTYRPHHRTSDENTSQDFSGQSDSYPCHLPCTPDLVAVLRPALCGRRMSLWVWVGAWPCWDANLSAPCKPRQRGPHLSPPPTCSSSGVARGRLTGLMRTTWTGLACTRQREGERNVGSVCGTWHGQLATFPLTMRHYPRPHRTPQWKTEEESWGWRMNAIATLITLMRPLKTYLDEQSTSVNLIQLISQFARLLQGDLGARVEKNKPCCGALVRILHSFSPHEWVLRNSFCTWSWSLILNISESLHPAQLCLRRYVRGLRKHVIYCDSLSNTHGFPLCLRRIALPKSKRAICVKAGLSQSPQVKCMA